MSSARPFLLYDREVVRVMPGGRRLGHDRDLVLHILAVSVFYPRYVAAVASEGSRVALSSCRHGLHGDA